MSLFDAAKCIEVSPSFLGLSRLAPLSTSSFMSLRSCLFEWTQAQRSGVQPGSLSESLITSLKKGSALS